ncbi:hypothetical protein VB773_09490 [Haloarculaceae archaeon H-GB2-1]|nr:hypothetical protein [Haloarculaceae archaeon H-GB1-1]MEA5386271.1 hypothetical protein [Haloarculaceae archaeon H-GB11]MEA5407774.1 hypothetical protein [Haloarculaceae archaeon H-GB2-1]
MPAAQLFEESNARVWWSVRDAFGWQKWIGPVSGPGVGMPLGIYVFSQFSEAQMPVAIGAVLALAVIIVGATQQPDVIISLTPVPVPHCIPHHRDSMAFSGHSSSGVAGSKQRRSERLLQ